MIARLLRTLGLAALLASASLPALAAVQIQNADGSASIVREVDGLDMGRQGGYMDGAVAGKPMFQGGSTMSFNLVAADTAGGMLGWTNNLGYDIIVTAHILEVTTKSSSASTTSCGQTATNATTSASNMISGQDTGTAAGIFNGGALSVKVKQGEFITCSKASGAEAGIVARAYFSFVAAPAAGKS